MFSRFFAVVACVMAFTGAAPAATVSGTFDVLAINVLGLDRDGSKATVANLQNAALGNLGSSQSAAVFSFSGALDFGTFDNTGSMPDETTVADWLASSAGSTNTLGETQAGADFGALQLSKPDIDDGTATTTFFFFSVPGGGGLESGTFTILHDDGVNLFEGDLSNSLGGLEGPNTQKTTVIPGYEGGEFGLLYVATNGDPSVLKVELETMPGTLLVPLPAGLPLLLAGLGGFAWLRRRQQLA